MCPGGLGGQKEGGTLPPQRQLLEAPSRWHLGRALGTPTLGIDVSQAHHDPGHPETPGTRSHSTRPGLSGMGAGVSGGLPAPCSVSGAQPGLTWGAGPGLGPMVGAGRAGEGRKGLSGSEG